MRLSPKIVLSSNLILAPMSGITSLPYRRLMRKFGCELAFTEMINCRSLAYRSKSTADMLASSGDDRPLGVQVMAEDENYLLKGLERLSAYDFDLVDFNAACPRKKVTSKGRGASLLREPKKLAAMLKVLVDNSRLPVTLKMRLGWDNSVKACDIALSAQDAGVSAVCLHGRTRRQCYSGQVDYAAIAAVKKVLKVPLIASGDIFSPELAKKMFDETGCDAVMLARGALGNPWIFSQIKEYLKTGEILTVPAPDDVAAVMRDHFAMSLDFYGSRAGVRQFRKFFIWYTKGFSHARPLRMKVSMVNTAEDMLDMIENFRAVCFKPRKGQGAWQN